MNKVRSYFVRINFLVLHILFGEHARLTSSKEGEQHHAIVIDASSTNTRAYYYVFEESENSPFGLKNVLEVNEKDARNLVDFEENFPGAAEMIIGLIEKLISQQERLASAQAFFQLEASSRFRLLKKLKPLVAEGLLNSIRNKVAAKYTQFIVCPNCVRVAEKDEVTYYNFISLNNLLGRLKEVRNDDALHGILDMGSGTTQIGIPLDSQSVAGRKHCSKMRIPEKFSSLLADVCIFAKSYSGMGTDEALLAMLSNNANCSTSCHLRKSSTCYHPSYSSTFNHTKGSISLTGVNLDPDDRYKHCSEEIKNNLSQLKTIGRLIGEKRILLDHEIYLIGGFYYAFTYVPRGKTEFKLKEIADLAHSICQNVKSSGQYEPHYCFRAAYFEQLFRDGYGFDEWQRFVAVKKISDTEVNWTFGAALNSVYLRLDKRTFENRGIPGASSLKLSVNNIAAFPVLIILRGFDLLGFQRYNFLF